MPPGWPVFKSHTIASQHRLDWRRLACLSNEELGRFDIAAVNLACAEGLPDAAGIDVTSYLARLDEWADMVQFRY